AFIRRRKGSCARCECRPHSSCFNGAAFIRRRKVPDVRYQPLELFELQRGRLHSKAESMAKFLFALGTDGLQRGRLHSKAESRTKSVTIRPVSTASTGPPSFEGGKKQA